MQAPAQVLLRALVQGPEQVQAPQLGQEQEWGPGLALRLWAQVRERERGLAQALALEQAQLVEQGLAWVARRWHRRIRVQRSQESRSCYASIHQRRFSIPRQRRFSNC